MKLTINRTARIKPDAHDEESNLGPYLGAYGTINEIDKEYVLLHLDWGFHVRVWVHRRHLEQGHLICTWEPDRRDEDAP